MPSLNFRFNTECQMTIESDSYEEAYLKFKDFMHGQTPISIGALEVCPPEDPKIFFEVDEQSDYSAIENFNGDFVKDIVENCREDLRTRMRNS